VVAVALDEQRGGLADGRVGRRIRDRHGRTRHGGGGRRRRVRRGRRRAAASLRTARRAREKDRRRRPAARRRSRRLTVVWAFLAPLALTLAIELPVAAALGLRDRRSLLAVACVSLITNPILTLTGWVLALRWDWASSAGSSGAFLLPAEILVVLVEWRLLLWALGGSPRRLLLVSSVMNAASVLAGVLLFWVP
jgi:hypothetical protein